jgi:hypothetical protein
MAAGEGLRSSDAAPWHLLRRQGGRCPLCRRHAECVQSGDAAHAYHIDPASLRRRWRAPCRAVRALRLAIGRRRQRELTPFEGVVEEDETDLRVRYEKISRRSVCEYDSPAALRLPGQLVPLQMANIIAQPPRCDTSPGRKASEAAATQILAFRPCHRNLFNCRLSMASPGCS